VRKVGSVPVSDPGCETLLVTLQTKQNKTKKASSLNSEMQGRESRLCQAGSQPARTLGLGGPSYPENVGYCMSKTDLSKSYKL
jgi:hypothetical protein